jgi:hypothetical protein
MEELSRICSARFSCPHQTCRKTNKARESAISAALANLVVLRAVARTEHSPVGVLLAVYRT